ncbi:hypothetical protein Trydic_g1642 [Trypoxylus dichotomus]
MFRTIIIPFIIVALNLNAALTQHFYWRDYSYEYLPCDAFEAAPGRYIGQVYQYGNMVGTIYPQNGTAIAEIYGKQNFAKNIKIFCTNRSEYFYWEKVNMNEHYSRGQMSYVVAGGYQIDGESQFPLYIGKAFHDNEWKIGKVVDIFHRWKGLWVWDRDGITLNLQEFYMMKYNPSLDMCRKPIP